MSQVQVELNINQLVGLFLAEIIRSRRTTIKRAAEICRRVVNLLGRIKSEAEVLLMLEDIERDFEEVAILKQALNFGYSPSDTRVYEDEIKIYVARLFERDIVGSAQFLQDAAEDSATIQHLCIKYPEFCRFLLTSTDKKELMKAFVSPAA